MSFCFAFAGCVSSSTNDEPLTESGRQHLAVDFENCTGSVAFSMQPFSATDNYLPPGYEPEDAGIFFSRALGTPETRLGQALFALIITDCTMSHTGLEEYLAVGWIFLKPPESTWLEADADYNFYEWARYTDGPTLPDSLSQFHWAAEIGNITTGVITQPPYLAARFWGLGDPTVFTMSHEGSGIPLDAAGYYRTWNAHENGTTTYDFQLVAQLLLGPGICAGEETHWTWDFLGGNCGESIGLISPNVQYAAFAGLDLDGEFHLEPDEYVT